MYIYVVFPKVKIIYFATSAPSFDKNNCHITHTVSRNAIIFRTEKAAPEVQENSVYYYYNLYPVLPFRVLGFVHLIHVQTLPVLSYFALSYLSHFTWNFVLLKCPLLHFSMFFSSVLFSSSLSHLFTDLLLFILINWLNHLSRCLCIFYNIGSTFSSRLTTSFLTLSLLVIPLLFVNTSFCSPDSTSGVFR